MKRKDWFVLLFVITTLILLFIHSEFGECSSEYYYNVWDEDLPSIEWSAAAYLLNPYFTVTAENFSDCMEDYFSAPAMLYFRLPTQPYEHRKLKDPKKVSAFGELFHDLQPVEISSEIYHSAQEDKRSCPFSNAIGHIMLHEYQGSTYISFSREASGTAIINYFLVENVNLIPECDQITASLEEYSDMPGDFELAENFG